MQNKSNAEGLWLGVLACTVAGFFYCYEFILRILPGALQSELSSAFGHLSAATFGQVAGFYYFAYSPMQLPVGMLMDRFGPRSLLTFACACSALGSYFFAFGETLWVNSAGRFMVGFGASFAFVGVLSLALHRLPLRFFSLVTGLVTTFAMFGVVYGGVKITALSSLFGLDYVLKGSVILGVGLTVIIFLILREDKNKASVQVEPFHLFLKQVINTLLSKQVWFIGIVGAFLYTSLSVFGELWGKTYLEQAHHLTKMDAAESVSLVFLGWALGAPVCGYWSDHTSRRVLPLVLGAFVSLLCISIILYVPGLSLNTLKSLLFIYGVAGGTEIIIFIMAKENSGIEASGTVFAVVNMIVSFGGMIFQPLVGLLLDVFGHPVVQDGVYRYLPKDFQRALMILPLALIVVIISGYYLKDQKRLGTNTR